MNFNIFKIVNNKSLFKKKKLIFLNTFALLLFSVAYYFYYLSLEKCLKGEGPCSFDWKWITLKIKQFIISVIIIIFLLFLIIYRYISKFHLIHLTVIFILFYKYSHSVFYYDHGGLNIIGFFFAIFISLVIKFILKLFSYIVKLNPKYKLAIILSLLYFYNIIIDPINCKNWGLGLNNTYIINDKNKYGCKIKHPKKCFYKIFSFTQDISKLFFVSCLKKKKNSREILLKVSKSPYINSTTIKFGFPLTNNEIGRKDGKDNGIIRKYSFKNLIDMDKPLPPKLSKPEYIVDFSNDPFGELLINLNYNDSLSKERNNKEINSIPYSNNILIIYIDSISRATSMRKLKKTLNFFEQFISYKGRHHKNYPNYNFHSFQFFKYHAHEGYTHYNFPILFYGNRKTAKHFVRINKYLKENGYITSYAADSCLKDNTNTGRLLSKEELYDHQLLLCDPNMSHISTLTKRCLYGNINSYYLFEYTDQFWRKYKHNRKFSLLVSNEAHEGTLELIKYTDDIIYNFLNSLYNDNLLKDSTIFLLSDHGCPMPSIYFLNDFYIIEKRLPMLYMIINDRKNINYNEQYFNINKNQQILITGYDIYNTIGNIVYGDNYINIKNKSNIHDTPKTKKGISLFDEIDPNQRNPKNYIYMSTEFCS